MTKKELREMLKIIVAEEIKIQLPAIMERVITENYLKNMVSGKIVKEKSYSSVSQNVSKSQKQIKRNGSPSLFEVLTTDEEPEEYNEVPQPEKNDDLGIYQGRPSIKEKELAKENKFLDPETNPLAFLYEGMNPEQQQTSVIDAPIEAFGLEKNNMMELAGIKKDKPKVSQKDLEKELQMKEQLLELKRKSLQGQQVITQPVKPVVIQEEKKESSISRILEKAMEKRSKYDFGMR